MIGDLLITLAFLAGIFSIFMYGYSASGYKNTLKFARIGYYLMSVFVIVASLILLNAILTHQFDYKYVYEYSGTGLSTGLLMSTFYAGQEGSFLLWTLFAVIVGLVLLQTLQNKEGYEAPVMLFFTITTTFLLLMVNPLLKSPFTSLWADPTFINAKHINPEFLSLPYLQNFFFSDNSTNKTFVKISEELVGLLKGSGVTLNQFIFQGKGLNPLLQNFWMQIHPPILFVGFALSAVPFSFAMGALFKNEYKNWLKISMPWNISGALILGASIMLGGYWAYGVLGWGGYWGWDPVENASLVPWLIWVALIHTALAQLKTQKEDKPSYVRLNLILSALTFVFVVYSTFLTRSGILQDSSVHSFVAPGQLVFLFLVVFMSTTLLMPVIMIYKRRKELSVFAKNTNPLMSRETILFGGTALILASAAIIIAGTSMPIFGDAIDISFYNDMNLPIAILIGVLNGYSLYFRWKENDPKTVFKSGLISLIITIVLTILLVFTAGIKSIGYILLAFGSIFIVVSNFEYILRVLKKSFYYTGGYIAHIGIGLFFLGVIATGGFSDKHEFDLELNKEVEIFDHKVTFTGYSIIPGTEKYEFNVQVNNDVVKPVMFFSEFSNGLMREPDIKSYLTYDFYLTPLSYNPSSASKPETQAQLKKGDTKNIGGVEIYFDSFNMPNDAFQAMQGGKEFFIGAKLVVKKGEQEFSIEPKMKTVGNKKEYIPVKIDEIGLNIQLTFLDASGTIGVSVTNENAESVKNVPDMLSVEVAIKPYIQLVWLGVALMVIGSIISTIRRQKEITS